MSHQRILGAGSSTKEKMIAVGAAMALAFGVTACSSEGAVKNPVPTETSISQPTSAPSEPATPKPTEPTAPAVSLKLVDPNYKVPDERKQELQSYDQLSIEEFDALPKSEQLAWMFFRSGMNGGGNLFEFAAEYHELTSNMAPGYRHYDATLDIYPDSISPENSLQEIMTIATFHTRQIARMKPGGLRDKALLAIRYDGLGQGFNTLKKLYDHLYPAKHFPDAEDHIVNRHEFGRPDFTLVGKMNRGTSTGGAPYVSGTLKAPTGDAELEFYVYYLEFENPFTGKLLGTWINY